MASVAEVLSHRGARLAALGWSAFVAENVALSHNRGVAPGGPRRRRSVSVRLATLIGPG